MRVVLLGTAAGGGFPQWNCACRMCVRAGKPGLPARSQDCVAVSADGRRWWLLNASPDIRSQVLAAAPLAPGPGPRETPLRGVLLTDAELDHALGLVSLREGVGSRVYGTEPVLSALRSELPLQGLLDRYGGARWVGVEPGVEFEVDGLQVAAIPVGRKRPKYAASSTVDGWWVVAFRVTDPVTGGTLLYAPCLAEWPDRFDEVLDTADCLLLDGTFYGPEEMSGATGRQVGDGAQRAMGHVPIDGPDGSLARLARYTRLRRIYTHLNNTNPVLDAASPERATVLAAGVEILDDGTELEL
ncbi:coenzyme PQQ synthesis protein B [Longimycelium tulufanense]|uniref:Coenzyme PQQ synthesis protein B n=1 Tax=Longimycelium tulufanense TaxID=907463 RepID=A0A8J3CH45_9PSEU|nr:pyrroloquinoline quinone biosynthesis protein PqqB [Longimycelium tulufanense]GGM68627.1 coenzyme PQQ synthesis protein B [Longimycelium tulufanense]